MASSPDAAKLTALRATRSVHPRAAAVTDGVFRTSDFFDPRDLVQVKYEMVRHVQREGISISAATRAFGLSRPTFYQARAALARAGLPGLLAQRRGPRQPHKFDPAVQAFLTQARAAEPTLSAAALARRIQERFGRSVHPRSVRRALARASKKGTSQPARRAPLPIRRSPRPTRRCGPMPSARLRPTSPPSA